MNKPFILTVSALMLASVAGMAQKLSPDTELLLLNRNNTGNSDTRLQKSSASIFKNVTDETVGVFITIKGEWVIDKLRAAGCSVGTVAGNIVTAQTPVELIPAIARIDGVEYIEAGHPMELKNFNTRRRIKTDDVHSGEGDLPRGYTGEGVVVGMIDAGFEYGHIMFRTYDGSEQLRVKRVWNQVTSSVGTPPEGYNYGIEYKTQAEILAAKNDGQSEFHGTHTSGTAAGSPAGNSNYYGMAPDADIIMVAADISNDTRLIDAIRYVFDYAEAEGKPCVINLSLGSHYGPHDGSSAVDRAIESMVGPGKIVVGAVGNEAGLDMHCSKTFTATDNTLKTMMAYTKGYTQSTLTYFYGTPGKKYTVEVALIDPTKKGRIVRSTGEIAAGSKAQSFFLDEGLTSDIVIKSSGIVVKEGDAPQIAIESYVNGLAANRKQAFIVRGEEGGTVHMWNAANNHYFIKGNLSDYTKGDDLYTAGEIGGTGTGVISVGSYDSDSIIVVDFVDHKALHLLPLFNDMKQPFVTGSRSAFSSRGPSADGRMKPEVMAPGSTIISAYNSIPGLDGKVGGAGGLGAFSIIRPSVDSNGNVYYYDISMGTSQATPAVTGTVALWLEANPNLTPDDIRGVIQRTSIKDSFTGTSPNNDCGYGKIDAYAGLRDVLGLTSAISDVQVPEKNAKVWVENGSTIYCAATGSAEATIYNVAGAKVGSFTVNNDNRSFDASHLSKGVYIVNVAGSGLNESLKVVIK